MRLVLALIGLLFALPATAQQWVDLELVLLADASRSIDDTEIAFQRGNYAQAITHPDVLGAIANGFRGRIAVTYVEWGDENWQDVVVPWTVIDGKAGAEAFAAELLSAPRRAQGPNAIGSAIAAGHALIKGNELEGERQVIDFSGDSAYSFGGIPVPLARAQALADGITINGLAILCRECDSGRAGGYNLEQAFGETVIGGPGAFVVTAESRESFAEAVRRKLLLEIAGEMPDTVARR